MTVVVLNVQLTVYAFSLNATDSVYDHPDYFSFLRYRCKVYYRIFYPARRFLSCQITQCRSSVNPRKFSINIRIVPAPSFRILQIVETFIPFCLVDQALVQLGYPSPFC